MHSFLIHPKTGKLSPVNQASSKGDSPCHLALDRGGRYLAVANCASGSVAVVPLRQDGGVGEVLGFAEHHGASHVDGVLFSPDNHYLLAADRGLDRIYIYRFDAQSGTISPAGTPYVDAPAGAGVHRLAFHPNGRILYAVNQTQPSVTAYFYDAGKGELSAFQTIPIVPESFAGPDLGGDIAVNTAGKLVYASNRGHDSMALLVVDPVRFTLSTLEITPLIGRTPGDFTLDPTGAYLLVANQESASLGIYTVHPHTGQLRPAGRPASKIDKVACVAIVPVP